MEYNFYPHTADSHLHLIEMKKKGIDIDSLLPQFFAGGLELIMDAAVDIDDFQERIELSERFPGTLLSAGIHPTSRGNNTERLEILKKQIETGKVRAIGETGLDFHWDTVPANTQKELFAAHIALSRQYNLPLIIHNRLADKEIFEILKSENAQSGVIHCFSSDHHFVRNFLDMGFYISFAGNITYKKSMDLREAAAYVPSDRLLVETDAPYLSPQKKRGRLNHPGHICYTIDCLADIYNKGADETAALTNTNFRKLFLSEGVSGNNE